MKKESTKALVKKLERFEQALKAIATYSAREKGVNEYAIHLQEIENDICACDDCAKAKANRYVSTNFCDKHYSQYYEARRRVDLEYEYQQKWEPSNIARKALEEK